MLIFTRLAQLYAEAQARPPSPFYGFIDGLPGFVTVEPDGMPQTTALEVRDGKIAAIYVVRNPEKLRHLEGATLQ